MPNTTPKTEDKHLFPESKPHHDKYCWCVTSKPEDSELRKQLEDFELEGVVTHRRAGSFKDTYIFTVADVNRLETLIASQREKGKLTVLKMLASKTTPRGDEIHPEYTKGFDEMKGKVKFELNRIAELTAQKERKG